jgi:iron complex outermembrane recepter protein
MQTDTLILPARRAVLPGLALSLLALGQPALSAQTAQTTDKSKTDNSEVVTLEKFEVTGSFRSSLQAAAELKQMSPTVTEVIAAEDIGKLPDVSIADSLTHVTGLTTQRVNGRAQEIRIRGLTGDFSTGLLNGREQVSTSENRAIEFDQYPADLMSQVIVYKTASPSLIDQGLAGTIDLQTVRPLSKPQRTVAANAYYDWTQFNQLTPGAKSKGEHGSVSYIDQLAGGTVGIALGVSHTNRPFEGEQFQAWGYPTDAAGNFVLGGTKSYVRTSNIKRDGLMAVLENKPSDDIHSTIDVFVSRFEEKQLLRGMEIPLWWSSAAFQPGATISGGLATSGVYTNVQPVVRNDVFKRNDSPFSIGWNLQLGQKSAWPVTLDAGFSRVTRTDVNLETYSGVGYRAGTTPNADTMTVKLIPGKIPVITSTLNYATGSVLRLTDPQGWGSTSLPGGGMMGYLKYFQAKDELGQIRASADHALSGMFKDVEVGASYSDRYKRDGEGPSGFINSPGAAQTLALPSQIGTTDMSFLGLGRIYAYDPLAAYSAGVWGFTPNTDTGIVANRFDVTEKIGQLYGQLNIKRAIGEMPLTGNIGGRVMRTDQTSKGYSANGNNLNAVSDGDKYTDFAPSLNLNLEVAKDTLIRLGVARQIARPRLYDMRAERSWGFNPSLAASNDLTRSPWSGGGGNAHLKPWRADSIDLSLEKYFHDHDGYVSLAAFHKNLLSYIYTQSSLANFAGYPSQGTTPVLSQGAITQPVNGSGGKIQGLEATASLMSELVNKDFHGFGLQLGGAYTDSSIKPWGPGNGDAPIAGLSRKMANVTLFYELHGFSARVSEHYQSASRQYITTFGPPNRGGDVSSGSGFTLAQPERVIDAQVSYTFRQTRAKGLTFYVQAYNLNNEPLITYNNGDPRQVMNYQKYGASYSAGVSYRF